MNSLTILCKSNHPLRTLISILLYCHYAANPVGSRQTLARNLCYFDFNWTLQWRWECWFLGTSLWKQLPSNIVTMNNDIIVHCDNVCFATVTRVRYPKTNILTSTEEFSWNLKSQVSPQTKLKNTMPVTLITLQGQSSLGKSNWHGFCYPYVPLPYWHVCNMINWPPQYQFDRHFTQVFIT